MLLFCLLCVFCFLSCQKDPSLKSGKLLQGNWRIESVRYAGSGSQPDSVANPPDASLGFDTYRDPDADGLFGTMRYKKPSGQVSFDIRIRNGSRLLILAPGTFTSKDTLRLTPQEKEAFVEIAGVYEILTLNKTDLVFECRGDCYQPENITFTSRRIRAVRQ